MKQSKRILTLAIAAAMALSITGCISKNPGGGANPSGGTNKEESAKSSTESTAESGESGTESTAESKETADTGKIDPLGKYDPPITVTSIRGTDASFVFSDGDSMENNVYTRMIEKELGIKVQYDFIVDNSQMQTKVATMLASNTMPDFFRAGPADFTKLAKQDAVLDMTKLYDDYSSERLKSLDASFKEGYDSGFVDGKHYGIADLGWGVISMPNIMWIRQDWLKQSGMEAPKTMEELNALAKKFQEDHPGTYGVALDKSLTTSVNTVIPIMNANHAYPKIWVEKDGALEYGSIQPEVKAALVQLQKMYQDGILDKEFAVKDYNKVVEDITNNKVGITFGCNNIGFGALCDLAKTNPEGAFLPYDIPKADDQPIYLQGGWPVAGYTVINKNMEHPEAVIKMMNFFCDRFADGTFDEPENRNTNYWSYPIAATQCDPNNEYNSYVNVSGALTSGDDSKITSQQRPFYSAAKLWQDEKDTVTDPLAYGRYVQMGPNGAYAILSKYVDDDRVLLDRMQGAVPDNYAKVQSTLLKLEDDAMTKIIMGAPIEEFDKFAESWKKLGGDDATKEVNEAYGK